MAPPPGAEAWRRLAAAVLLQAVKDAAGEGFHMEAGDREDALEWLQSEQAQCIACELDMENSLERWLHAGRPGRWATVPLGRPA